MNRKLLGYLFLALASVPALHLAACSNTMEGAGRDIENAGEAIQENNEANPGY